MKRDAKKQKNRQQIINAGRKLMMEKGVKGTSIRLVSETSGISFVTMYKYFDTKSALAEAVVQDLFTAHSNNILAVVGDSQLDFKTKLREFTELSADFMNSVDPSIAHEFITIVHENSDLERNFEMTGDKIWSLLIGTGRAEKVINPDISDQAIRTYTNLFIEFIESPAGRAQSKQVISQLEWLFTYGLTGRQD